MSDEMSAGQSNLDSSQDTESISMVEILEEENRLKADAAAVLGASDDKNCTYSKGYVPRQALYACSTCSRSENVLAGICLACSYECHEGHDLYELYTKRSFRCDCGNEKFPNLICKFEKEKDATNSRNRYSQNFKGLYCSCHRPYPDPDDEVEDDMIQCILCEDWYHGRHLGLEGSLPSDFEEMICPECVNNHDFLSAYAVNTAVTVVEKENGKTQVDVVNTDEGSSTGRKRNLSGECTSPQKTTSFSS
ncbi:putative E3 ubiquitin-protein ligase UBR7 [Patella vulgata]|uniref:putative E3 ubiquitin-protein ligase UBR7 n=1 Tax=Patella vulgata TaxID=6465 RepID=UPI0024A9BBE9|nr:putative E3 ubiquitin-protein ligase UBR7 [Patella vulgata]